MLDLLKLKESKNNSVFFYSDLHICHEKDFILQPRGFKSAEEGREILINGWNSVVTEQDAVFLLGDSIVGAGENSENVFIDLLLRLNFKDLYLMPGNHFAGLKQLINANYENKLDNFGRVIIDHSTITRFNPLKSIYFISNYYEVFVNSQHIVLSHYPIYSWNGIGKGSWHLHGHCHGRLNPPLKGKALEICPESIGNSPLSFNNLKGKFDKIPIEVVDYH